MPDREPITPTNATEAIADVFASALGDSRDDWIDEARQAADAAAPFLAPAPVSSAPAGGEAARCVVFDDTWRTATPDHDLSFAIVTATEQMAEQVACALNAVDERAAAPPAETPETPSPTWDDVLATAARLGYVVDEFSCAIQGVLVSMERPTRDGESFIGLPVAGPTRHLEVIERPFRPYDGPTSDEVMAETQRRAFQHAIWSMESDSRPAPFASQEDEPDAG